MILFKNFDLLQSQINAFRFLYLHQFNEGKMSSNDNNSQKGTPTKISTNFDQDKTTSSTLKVNIKQSAAMSFTASLIIIPFFWKSFQRNPKMELNKTDLLKLLSYLEGELQARDVVIATLKAEKVKRLLTPGRFWINSLNDPRAALQRDAFGSAEQAIDEEHIQSLADHQMMALENYIMQHRKMASHMYRLMKEMEERHKKVVQDLEEEKRKHEHDTAQGDDITYGLEKERTRLKQVRKVDYRKFLLRGSLLMEAFFLGAGIRKNGSQKSRKRFKKDIGFIRRRKSKNQVDRVTAYSREEESFNKVRGREEKIRRLGTDFGRREKQNRRHGRRFGRGKQKKFTNGSRIGKTAGAVRYRAAATSCSYCQRREKVNN